MRMRRDFKRQCNAIKCLNKMVHETALQIGYKQVSLWCKAKGNKDGSIDEPINITPDMVVHYSNLDDFSVYLAERVTVEVKHISELHLVLQEDPKFEFCRDLDKGTNFMEFIKPHIKCYVENDVLYNPDLKSMYEEYEVEEFHKNSKAV